MNNNLIKLVFILDCSGSMYSLISDTIGGYNSLIKEQKNQENDIILTTVLFNINMTYMNKNVAIKDVKKMTMKDYVPSGCTALLDTLGNVIIDVGNELNNTPEAERPSKVRFVIITDGQENASTEFTMNDIKEMIKHQIEKYNWDFVYLGANVDSFTNASNLNINTYSNYSANTWGTQSVYSTLSRSVSKSSDITNSDLNDII